MIARGTLLRYHTGMEVYVQVKRTSGRPPEIKVQPKAPEGWDDSEEKDLEWLARGASLLARKNMQGIDLKKAEECKKKLLAELRLPD